MICGNSFEAEAPLQADYLTQLRNALYGEQGEFKHHLGRYRQP